MITYLQMNTWIKLPTHQNTKTFYLELNKKTVLFLR